VVTVAAGMSVTGAADLSVNVAAGLCVIVAPGLQSQLQLTLSTGWGRDKCRQLNAAASGHAAVRCALAC
jgi:hypothetical protein